MKHQQPQMNNGQQQEQKQASEFREHYAEFLPTADKESQQSENTEFTTQPVGRQTSTCKEWGCQ